MSSWNPSDKSAFIVLTESNRLATVDTGNPGWAVVRGDFSKSAASANHYLEIEVDLIGSGWMAGIGKAGVNYVSADFYALAGTGVKWNSGSGTAYGSAPAQDDIIGVLLKNGSVYFSLNGTWIAGADPVAETGAAFTGLTGDFFPMVAMDPVGMALRARFVDTQQVYSPPSGSSSWAAGGVTGTAAATLVITAAGYGAPAVSGTGAAELVITAAGIGGPSISGYANALFSFTAAGVGEAGHVFGDGAATLAITASGSGVLYSAGGAAAELVITASGVGGVGVSGTGVGTLSITASATGGHGVSGTGAATLTIYAAGGDWPTGSAAATFSITASAVGRVGDASAGTWLYIHTTPPAQIYSVDALRGRLNPYLPSHRIDWSATDVRAEVGRTNDSWAAELIGANPTLRNRLATQAAYGIRVDLYDGGDIARTGISYGVGYNDRSLILDVQSDVWTRDIPMRTSADLGTFRDVETLPIRYGRNVPGKLISINQARTLWLWADHASLAIRSVTIDGQPYGAWSWRNDIDGNGHPITVVQTSEQIDDGADMVAVGDGAMDADTGALLVNPSDIARDLCRLGGLTVARSDFAGYRAECLDRNLELSGTVDGGSLQAVMTRISESTHSAFARQLPGYLRLLPLSAPAVTTISPDAVMRADQEGDIATRLRVRYGVEEKGPRRSIEVRAPAIEVRYGVKSQDVDLPMIRDDRSAVDVASRMLVDLARPAYRVQCKRQQREWLPGEVASVSVLALGISGNAMVQASQIGERSSAPTLLLHVGDEPAISLVTVTQAYSPEAYTGATVATSGSDRVITVTDDAGLPLAGAQCRLDGSLTRVTDGAGRVSFPLSAMPPGQHYIDVIATGFSPFRLTVTV